MKRKYLVAAVIAAAFTACLWKNWLTYRRKSWRWLSTKTIVDTALAAVLVMFMPLLLSVYCTLWAAHHVKPGWKQSTVSVFASTFFMWLCEVNPLALMVFGAWSMDIVTSNYVDRYRRAKFRRLRKVLRRAN